MSQGPSRHTDIRVPEKIMLLKKFLSAGFVSSAAVTLTAPLDRAKLLLQIQRMSTTVPVHKRYKGLFDVLRRVPKEQGFTAFWRGNTASIIRVFPYNALNFTFRDVFRGLLFEHVEHNTLGNRIILNLLAGGLSGSASLVVTYPLDYTRTRMAMDIGRDKSSREFSSIRSCLRDAYQSSGIYGIYRGLTISVLGIFLFRSAFFGVYDTGTELIPLRYHNPVSQFFLAQTGALLGTIISYPVDTIRRSMMMHAGQNPKGKLYKSSVDCAIHIFAKDGTRGFFRGLGVNLLRGTTGSLMLILNEAINVYVWEEKNGQNFLRREETNYEKTGTEVPQSISQDDVNKCIEPNGKRPSRKAASTCFCSF